MPGLNIYSYRSVSCFAPAPRGASAALGTFGIVGPLQQDKLAVQENRMRCMSTPAVHLRLFYLCFLTLTLVCGSSCLRAQMIAVRVDPHQTDPAIETVHGPHLAMYDPTVPSRHRLLLFIAGTHAKATSSLPIDKVFSQWGYHTVSLDYENNVVAASLGNDLNPAAFGNYREAIVTGAPVSRRIQVDSANSILNRFQKLLTYLVIHDPGGHWDEFLSHGRPDWSRIVVAGHSQGSGHAAYIGQMFRVDRVLMFSGPQDYMDGLHRPAAWLKRPSATPPSRYFAFLNLQDPFNVHHQIANCMTLMHMSKLRVKMVYPGEMIRGNYRILINDIPTEAHHNSTLFPQFQNVWKYMAIGRVD